MLSQKNVQGSEFPMPRELTSNVGANDVSVVQDLKKSVKPSFNGMPPPPPRSVTPLSPPPKFNLTPKVQRDNNGMEKSKHEVVPDTLIKLMEYGGDDDDDDDLEETAKEPLKNQSNVQAVSKPFWAV